MFGLAHRAVLLAQPKMHSAILRQVCKIWSPMWRVVRVQNKSMLNSSSV
jgi:hypothetical protein